MQKVYRYVHENKFPELKDKNVTYLLKISSGRSKQSVEFFLRKFEIKLGLSKRISQERWKTRENIQLAASARKVTQAKLNHEWFWFRNWLAKQILSSFPLVRVRWLS